MLREAWTLAVEALSWMELRNLSEQHALAKTAKQLDLRDSHVLGLAYKMICETTQRKNLIDKLVNAALTPETLDTLDLGVQSFLRLYAYRVKFGKCGLADAVETVNIGRHVLGWKTLQKVEGALGRLYGTPLNEAFADLNDVEKTAYKSFHPSWYIDYCFKVFGRKKALKIFEADNNPQPTYVRLNVLKDDEDALLARIETEKIRLEKEKQLKYTYRVLETGNLLAKTSSFAERLFFIEDKASCFSVEAADPKPGMRVLDVYSSVYAKTVHLAQLMNNKGVILSVERSKQRIRRLEKEVRHAGVNIVYSVVADACNPLPFRTAFDLVILNPPSSGTGVFSKNPSYKWRLTPRSLREVAERQWQMLNSCAECVSEGGFLLYVTCSVTLEENEALIERFLKWHPEFRLTNMKPKIGLPGVRGLSQCQRLYPHIHRCGGIFTAKLAK